MNFHRPTNRWPKGSRKRLLPAPEGVQPFYCLPEQRRALFGYVPVSLVVKLSQCQKCM